MPASGAQDAKRGRLLQGFFWGGVGLATLAMLVLLFSQSVVVLRVAVILCVVAIMMLAISIVLRPSVEMVRVDIEEHLIGEVERVRLRAREDISTAARNTHRVLSEKIHVLTATVEALRAQIEEMKVSTVLGGGAGPHMGPASTAAGVVHRTETVHVTRRTTTVDPGDDATRGTVYGSRSAVDGEWSEDRGEDRGTRSRAAESDWSSQPAEAGYGEADWEATFRSLSRQQSALPASPGRPANWYTGVEDEPGRSRGRERERESRRDFERETRRDFERERRRDFERETRQEREPDRGRHSEPDYGRHSDWYSDRGREREREYDRERRHDGEREPRHDREYERRHDDGREARHDREYERRHDDDGYRDAPHDRYRDRGPDRYRDEGRGRHQRHDDRDHDRGHERDHERAHSRDRERGYDGDSDVYGRGYDQPLPRPRSPHAFERER